MAKVQKVLQLKLRSPYQNYFSGTAQSVSANNRVGRFDILPDHTPYFTLLEQGTITVRTEREAMDFKVNNGILKVKNNQVDIFLNI